MWCTAKSKVPMGLRFHRTLPEIQLVRFMVQLRLPLVQSCFCLVLVFLLLTKNYLFHVHICFPPQILVFIYHTTDNQAVLAENQRFFCEKCHQFLMGIVVFSTFCFHSPFQAKFYCNLQLPGCAQTQGACVLSQEHLQLSRSYKFQWGKKNRLKSKEGGGEGEQKKALRGNN